MSLPDYSNEPCNFIVGTGRCGSTILSEMIGLHPDVVVLNEFFVSLDFARKYGQRPVTGEALADILDCGLASNGDMKKIDKHLMTPEITFDQQSAPAPVNPSDYKDNVLPDLILLPLPHLFDDPVAIFDELVQFAREQPVRQLSEHYIKLFQWLTVRAGKTLWIERSGGTIAQLPELVELFPNGRFLHLHRDPLDVAVSMHKHHHFRLRTFKHNALVTETGVSWSSLDDSDINNDMPMSDRLKSIFDYPLPLDYLLKDWSDSVLRGFTAIKQLSPEQYTEVSFEDMMIHTKETLEQIAQFFKFERSDTWLSEASSLINSDRPSHSEPDAQQAQLVEKYCHAAMVLLGRRPTMALYQ